MHWSEGFRRKVTTADEAVKVIKSATASGPRGCNNPEELIHAMTGRAGELEGVEVAHLLTFGAADYADPKYAGSFRHRRSSPAATCARRSTRAAPTSCRCTCRRSRG